MPLLPHITSQPTPAQIDKWAEGFLAIENTIKAFKKNQDWNAEVLIACVLGYGSLKPNAAKKKHLPGERYEMNVSQGQSVELLDAKVKKFKKAFPRVFRKFFRLETKFVYCTAAESAMHELREKDPKVAKRIELALQKCVKLKPKAPSLSIVDLKAQAEAKAAKDAAKSQKPKFAKAMLKEVAA